MQHDPVSDVHSGEESATRQQVVDVALSELGNSDEARYWDEVLAPGQPRPDHSWCGAFALWVLRIALDMKWTYDDDGAWFYRLPWTSSPRPGDLAFIEETRHLAIVASATPERVQLINGAGMAGKVTISNVPRQKVTEFRSIGPLLPVRL